LSARIKELEEELTRVAGERDTFRSRAKEVTASAKAIAGQLGEEQGADLLMKGALAEALKVAEASWVEVLAWKEKAEGESHRPSPLFGLFPFRLTPSHLSRHRVGEGGLPGSRGLRRSVGGA